MSGTHDPGQHAGSPPEPPTATLAAAPDPLEGRQIGPYRLLGVLGEGGFGIVYLAERREPIVQRVALKVIKPGMDSRAVLARFEQERQALAVMDHPNVARVFDAGATPEGRPYFVMEHVAGEPITAWCDRERLTVRQRLALFIPVCEAVQHAHHKGIIHRDLKPSNILVSVRDGHAAPKVIDFGVAKAISHTLTDRTIFTEQGQIIGTPEYMSPEQAEMGATDVDTRTDVYSLGVVLYELLSGALPFDPATLRAAGYGEIQRIIREVDPPRPSTRISALGAAGEEAAQRRGSRAHDLERDLRRELEWIPLRAIRKDRRERYQTPIDLADDLRNYLAGRPLQAGPESTLYRIGKFVRRNRAPVLAAAGMLALLVAGVVGTGFGLYRAEQRRAEAERRARETALVAKFQSEMLAGIDAAAAGARLFDDLAARLDAALAARQASAHERSARAAALAELLAEVNATDTATAMIDRTILAPAAAALERRFGDLPAVDASLRQAIAEVYIGLGLLDRAAPLQEQALATRRRALGELHADTLTSVNNLGYLLDAMGRFEQAAQHHRAALEGRLRLLGPDHPDTLDSADNLGNALAQLGRFEEAEPHLRRALEGRRRVLGDDHPRTISSINNVAYLLDLTGRVREAEPLYREVIDRRRRVLGDHHPNTLNALSNLGALLASTGRAGEAEPCFRAALEGHRESLGADHPDTLMSMQNLGAMLVLVGRHAEAEPLLLQAVAAHRRVLGPEHPETLACIATLGELYIAMERFVDAEACLRDALAGQRSRLGDDHPDTLASTFSLGEVLRAAGKPAEAEAPFRDALRGQTSTLGPGHADTLRTAHALGTLLLEQGRLEDAAPLLLDAAERAESSLPRTSPERRSLVLAAARVCEALHAAHPDAGHLVHRDEWLRRADRLENQPDGAEHLPSGS